MHKWQGWVSWGVVRGAHYYTFLYLLKSLEHVNN